MKKTIALLLAIAMLATLAACGGSPAPANNSANNAAPSEPVSVWKDKIPAMPLPTDVANLPTVIAEPWLQVNESLPVACMEGSIFDPEGNLYYCFRKDGASEIVKITPEKEISVVYHADPSQMIGLAVHKDGRFFVCDALGKILIVSKDGKVERDLLADHPEYKLQPNDMVFDKNGNLYFTDFSGTVQDPVGGVYRIDAEGDYKNIHLILGGMASANGIVLNAKEDELWVAETYRGCVNRIRLDAQGFAKARGTSSAVFYNQGVSLFDSTKMDASGNIYQTVNNDGRIVVLNKYGVPVANIVVPDREKGDCLFSPNLAIKPGTNEGYLLCSGTRGAWLFKFETIDKAQELFADR